ncbi:tripartite tricarboxylate transporter substrate binding protein [Pusillimonas sp. SM2304]|uniref:Bug family tripartite tricarboxylate transporter substrate binding protein n=1 Tax=Pusillimonas sp. SM2304 TaxID=3073241 RepID=UPI002875422E|nr:tripartite tricarboxylate transporter substrate binding protein [Pusillimonas sp. SM2304]MDS1140072.1 tripartite tricarboxylate transporter substrate binding protein [Pusillimonas sp. SM2304]
MKSSSINKILAGLLGAVGMLTMSLPAAAQSWPERPIRMVIPFATGGGTDILGRFLAQKMSEGLGQTIVVENKPGAGGSVGTADVAKAKPDGYTFLLGSSSTHGINPVLYSKLPYDPIKDFAPIAIIATNKFVMAVPSSLPANNLQEFLALTRADPEKYVYASSGNGTTSHLAGALFTQMSGIPLMHIPYKSNVPALNDLMAGRVSVMFDNITAMQGQLASGMVKPIATTGDTRSPILPDVPTMQEQGLKDYRIGGWFCMVAPAGTPAEITERIYRELARVVALPEVAEKMIAIGADPQVGSPAELQQLIATEIPRWKSIVDMAGAKVE